MSDIAISVENLSKKYHIGRAQQRHDTLRDALVAGVKAPFERLKRGGRSSHDEEDTIWALKDVSFEVSRGEVVGVIGRNGAGKSTLLKILTQITEPTSGRAAINGRVGSLLEVGTGFHQELTGRENIYLSGAILGMRRAEIARKLDEIVYFSGVEKFIDTPVKRYSSGMKVRLGFAVAAHLDPEILLIDEVLAVGDAAFQKKCIGKMQGVAKSGRTVLFVSHNMAAIHSLCSRAVFIEEGRVDFSGETELAIKSYLETATARGEITIPPDAPRMGSGTAWYERIRILDSFGDVTDKISMGDDLTLEMKFACSEAVEHINFGVAVRGPMQERILQCLSRVTKGEMPTPRAGGIVKVTIERLNLVPGTYYLSFGISRQNEQVDYLENILQVDVMPRAVYPTGKIPKYGSALIYLYSSWEHDYS